MNYIIDGILIVDKPKDWTSHDVCAFVRKRFKINKVGHAGTLDPMATGVLVVLLGKATKQSMFLSSCDKEYAGIMELGIKTSSHDRTGTVLETAPWESVTLDEIRAKAAQFTGEQMQLPPMVSAIKHQGVRLYQLARKGIDVPREERKIHVYRFEILKKEGAYVHFVCTVSKGTYLRTLVHDVGEALGCFAALADLRRVRSGDFKIENGVTVETLKGLTADDLRKRILPLYPVPHVDPHRS